MENTSGELSPDVSNYPAKSRTEIVTFINNVLLEGNNLKRGIRESWINNHYPEYYYCIINSFGTTLSQKLYNLYHNITTNPVCDICGNKVNFFKFSVGYNKTCSKKCALQQCWYKRVATYLKNYGVDNPQKCEQIKEKTRQTCIEKYGVDNVFKIPNFNRETQYKLNINKWNHIINPFIKEGYFIKTTPNTYKMDGYFMVICPRGHESKILMSNWKAGCRCGECSLENRRSKPEIELNKILKQYVSLETSVRNIIPPQEIDIFIPSHNLAIEYNGLYWHSKENKNYHLNKTIQCNNKGVQLIHIFEDEWLYKQDIVKSILLSKIGKYDSKIYSRKCDVIVVNSKDKKEFLNKNHIQGDCISSVNIGLLYNNEIVSLMTFKRRNISWEMSRFCNKPYTQVIGGANKLFKYFTTQYDIDSVISYADRRWGDDGLYNELGFELQHTSAPNYWYLYKREIKRYNRVNFQKHKLNIYNENKTEYENMCNNGYSRIWDCGSLVFKWEK